MVPSPLCGQMVPFVNFVGKTNIKNHDFYLRASLRPNGPFCVALLLCAGAVLGAFIDFIGKTRTTIYISNSMCPAELLY